MNVRMVVLAVIGLIAISPVPAGAQMTEARELNAPLASWELGKNLGFAALVRGRHGPDSLVKKTLLEVSQHAHDLGVEVPAPGPLTDDVTADTAEAIHFILETAGKPIYHSLQEQYGDSSSALFELGTKSTLLLLLYQPEDSANESFTSAIERSATRAKLDAAIWQPLVADIKENKTTEELRSSHSHAGRRDAYTAICSPANATAKLPILLHRTPYGCAPYGEAVPEPVMYNQQLVNSGYIFVYQDLRSRSMSDGDPEFENLGPVHSLQDPKRTDEVTDAADTIDWLLQNVPGHNGRIGMFGILTLSKSSIVFIRARRSSCGSGHSLSTKRVRLLPE